MSELLRIQRALQNHLLQSPLLQNHVLDSSDADANAALNSLIVESERVPRATRLNIYANAYRARIAEALSVDFCGLHTYVGDEAFAELIDAYIERHPSHYFSLRNIGGELTNYLKITSPYAAHAELHELAQFEWTLCHAFDAADAMCADAAYFSTLPPQQWPDITLRFLPSLRILSMRSNAPEIWKSLNAKKEPPVVEISAKEQSWIVWRRDLKILFRPLDTVEKVALDIFMRGETFFNVCDELAEELPESEVPQRSVNILQQWLADGLIVAP